MSSQARNSISTRDCIVHTPYSMFWQLQLFSLQCRKTKAEVIIVAKYNRRRQFNEPIETRSKNAHVAGGKRGTTHETNSRSVLVFTSDWLIKWSEIFLAHHKAWRCIIKAAAKLLSTLD